MRKHTLMLGSSVVLSEAISFALIAAHEKFLAAIDRALEHDAVRSVPGIDRLEASRRAMVSN